MGGGRSQTADKRCCWSRVETRQQSSNRKFTAVLTGTNRKSNTQRGLIFPPTEDRRCRAASDGTEEQKRVRVQRLRSERRRSTSRWGSFQGPAHMWNISSTRLLFHFLPWKSSPTRHVCEHATKRGWAGMWQQPPPPPSQSVHCGPASGWK